MGIKKNAGKANIKKNLGKAPTKETVKTPFSECTAENPLECKYHGLQALNQMLGPLLAQAGYNGEFSAYKVQGGKGYEFKLDGDFSPSVGFGENLQKAFDKMGWYCGVDFPMDYEGEPVFYLMKPKAAKHPTETNEDATKKDDVDLVDADLSDLDEFAGEGMALSDEDDIDLMPLIGNPDKLKEDDEGITDDEPSTNPPMGEINEIDLDELDELAGSEMSDKGENNPPAEPTYEEWEEALDILKKKDPYAGGIMMLSDSNKLASLKEAQWHSDKFVEPFVLVNQNAYKSYIEDIAKIKGKDSPIVKAMVAAYKGHNEYDMTGLEQYDISGLGKQNTSSTIYDKFIGLLGKAKEKGLTEGEGWLKKSTDLIVAFSTAKQKGDTNAMSNVVKDLEKLVENTAAPIKEKVEGAESSPKTKHPSLEPVSKQEPATKSKESPVIIGGIDESLMKPLEHDETKFPQNLTLAELKKAIANGKDLGGNSGENATRINLGGRLYVVKSGSGSHKEHLLNEAMADKAYREGGINVPDFQLYNFGSTTYKLAEFIEGKSLADYMYEASPEQKEKIRQDLLKGYPLDVLFSNWDVIGTSRDNVLVDKNGTAWRIDNGGSFALKAMGGEKNLDWAKENYAGKVAFEDYDAEGGWRKRQWIDDFRTMRRDSKNKGLFDNYSTADIFLAAGNIDLNKVVESISDKSLREALEKPLFEMKQMARSAVSAVLSGYSNNEMLSMALDAMYDGAKEKLREQCIGEIKKGKGGGFGEVTDDGSVYTIQPNPVKPPPEPVSPLDEMNKDKLKNAEYTGTTVADLIIGAAKTVNYHMGHKGVDKDGNPIGSGMPNPDYKPNPNTIAKFNKIDREKLEYLAKEDASAKTLLDMYDAVSSSIASGNNIPILFVEQLNISKTLPADFMTAQEKAHSEHFAEEMEKFKVDHEKWEKVLMPKWEKDNEKWLKNELEKQKKSGKKKDKTFWDFCHRMAKLNIDTNGIERGGNAEGIQLMDEARYYNKYSTSKNDCSWQPYPCRTKILDLVFSGMSLEDIKNITDTDPRINNGHHSSKKATKNFYGAADYYLTHPQAFAKDKKVYSLFKGLQVMKLQNESGHIEVNGKKVDVYDHEAQTIILGRADNDDSTAVGKVAPVKQQAPVASGCYQEVGTLNAYPYLYEVPFWAVSYAYTDHNLTTSSHSAYLGDEDEWVFSAMGLPAYRTNYSVGFGQAMENARKTKEFTDIRNNRKNRLKPFETSMLQVA